MGPSQHPLVWKRSLSRRVCTQTLIRPHFLEIVQVLGVFHGTGVNILCSCPAKGAAAEETQSRAGRNQRRPRPLSLPLPARVHQGPEAL